MPVASRSTDRLAVFNIDGTLTLTNRVDDHCFRAAHYARFGAAAAVGSNGEPTSSVCAIATGDTYGDDSVKSSSACGPL